MEEKIKNIFKTKIERKKLLWIITGVSFFLLSVALISLVLITYKTDNISPLKLLSIKLAKKQDYKVNNDHTLSRRCIDGVFVENGENNLYPIAIIIDNHIDARPPSGLSEANLVIEAEAEGGITRFLAIYANNEKISKIGPVRSARPYFVDWANEFSAVFAHCGGSPEALVKIKADSLNDLNEFYNDIYFWRDKSKIAPHNVYTSSDLLLSFIKKSDLEKGKYFCWDYKEDIDETDRPLDSKIEIEYRSVSFSAVWQYDRTNNSYDRYISEKLHKDATGEKISAKNIVIQYIEAEEIDELLRLKLEHIGSGRAVVCLDGACEEGTWKKRSKTARTRFYLNNNEVKFNAGNTWIEVVGPDYKVNL